jgi:hypothetical protein
MNFNGHSESSGGTRIRVVPNLSLRPVGGSARLAVSNGFRTSRWRRDRVTCWRAKRVTETNAEKLAQFVIYLIKKPLSFAFHVKSYQKSASSRSFLSFPKTYIPLKSRVQ